MKVTFDASSIKPALTGLGRYTHLLLQEYLRLFPEHEYILYRVTGIRNFFPDQRLFFHGARNIRIRTFGIAGRMIGLVRKFFPVDEIFLRDADVIHAQGSNFPALLSKKKIVVTIHDLISLVMPDTCLPHIVKEWRDWLKTFPKKEIKWIIADSECTKKDLIEIAKTNPDKIKVIPLAVSPEFMEEINEDRVMEVLLKLNLSKDYIFSVGRIEPRKNFERLIQAYNLLRQRKEFSGKLVISGIRGYRSEKVLAAREKSTFKDDIILTGYLPDETLVCLYKKAAVMAFVSLYEGFGLPLLEAFASNIPVVTSNVSSLPEVGGDAAIYVNPYEVESIAQGIKTAVQDSALTASLVKKGKEQLEKYSWENTARETFKLYLA